jgi:hypothetical protein
MVLAVARAWQNTQKSAAHRQDAKKTLMSPPVMNTSPFMHGRAIQPFYQGKLDVFCAFYAVLNGIRLTHGIGTLQARDVLHGTLLSLASDLPTFQAVLEQRTDYIGVVDGMLRSLARTYPLQVVKPFTEEPAPSPAQLWRVCADFMHGGSNRAVLFRFFRYITPDIPPINRHWTVVEHMRGKAMHLFDCSHESGAILDFAPDSFVTSPEDVALPRLCYIDPVSIRFLSAR